eukprot:gnl/MRDRNA2_/MRDRNA2_105768_c0_seq1.p1 gnl/MRDRNA2_/MRDRNA2_105768_c0~~gnl/MRDRNA2_/MRDRNA2_105768_c0_seq1.p1  ORF type:complete len:187 (-),score=46.48 gnl/MRDRNA2_/MRDRNA2_105768_c0_seq1:109-669(-)
MQYLVFAQALLLFARTTCGVSTLRGRQPDPPPSPDDKDLFGAAFDVPMLDSDSGAPVAHVNMRLAVTGREQEHGLMFIKDMPENDGMLFLYKEPAKRVLWMKDTYIPLDAGWFTQDGVLQEVHSMPPQDETWRWSNSSDITDGLEMNVDWYKRHGVKPGHVKMDLKAVRDGLTRRGYNADEFFPVY